MKILAFDTALNACSVTIADRTNILAHVHEKRRRGHAETLLPMIEAEMKKAGLAYKDLDLIAVTVGPGTFTGLRIGLAAARGIAIAARKPIIGLTTLETLTAAVPVALTEGRPVIAAVDARRGEVYVQAFKRLDQGEIILPLTTPTAIRTELVLVSLDIETAVVVGSGARLLESMPDFDAEKYKILDFLDDPDAVNLVHLAAVRGLPAAGAPSPAPLYLRAPDAKLPGGKDPLAG
ncbi:tRNA (adenosine(37)-N6)-threonylcarbamoyltransferase complex dimerization subunit type 1 TsaB [Sneathiella sp.]|uniref:tRNA (adenosine(37)-N6)-threonylcarbamoyltransferase complex dimerization subunit type 1 TsaB n=1 Tax=Sneathiella sp. TaxID=1964365 RepID=UPI0026316684|nr:tRNA (adenosine(37)-N6)-threonylcarbamoyltransferase complex dimerization subunit type 1 TsaB [Sneathiella sp.]MDF2367000.1 tRNA (adenosine(37)-N6)-threonylcarbamoyltransferase complex dimerization subunit type 1 TsaB [Sneathiella sp.]